MRSLTLFLEANELKRMKSRHHFKAKKRTLIKPSLLPMPSFSGPRMGWAAWGKLKGRAPISSTIYPQFNKSIDFSRINRCGIPITMSYFVFCFFPAAVSKPSTTS
jgi:hypothetical protein